MIGNNYNSKRVRELVEENSKMQLAIMLVNCEEELKKLREEHNLGFMPPRDTQRYTCRSWDDCVNPHYDCVNCPLRNGGGGSARQFVTTTTTTRPQA